MTYYPCVDIEGLRDIDDALCNGLVAVELDTVTAVEYLEHLLHRDLTGLVDRLEDSGKLEEIILYDSDILTEITALSLSAACAVDDSGDGISVLLEYWNDYLNPLIYLSSTENMTLPLALSYFSTQHSTNLSATMAAAALIMIPAAIVFIIFQKQFIKGLALTGMK